MSIFEMRMASINRTIFLAAMALLLAACATGSRSYVEKEDVGKPEYDGLIIKATQFEQGIQLKFLQTGRQQVEVKEGVYEKETMTASFIRDASDMGLFSKLVMGAMLPWAISSDLMFLGAAGGETKKEQSSRKEVIDVEDTVLGYATFKGDVIFTGKTGKQIEKLAIYEQISDASILLKGKIGKCGKFLKVNGHLYMDNNPIRSINASTEVFCDN